MAVTRESADQLLELVRRRFYDWESFDHGETPGATIGFCSDRKDRRVGSCNTTSFEERAPSRR